MPRTKQPKMSKKQKKDMNSSDSSILSNTSGNAVTYKSAKEIEKEVNKEKASKLKLYDDALEKALKTLENADAKLMLNARQKELLRTTTMKDFLATTKKCAENPEYGLAFRACLAGTYEPVVPVLNLPGSSVKSGASIMSSASTQRPPSSASSTRSGHTSRQGVGAFAFPGSASRSRSVVKAPHQHSGMRRRSMSQPNSVKKNQYLTVPNMGRTPIITPKVNPDQSSAVLRLPMTGENLFSVDGSPVLPNAQATSSKAPQALIPLRDGKMLAVLSTAQNMARPMEFSPDTKRNLMQLKNNLDFLMKE